MLIYAMNLQIKILRVLQEKDTDKIGQSFGALVVNMGLSKVYSFFPHGIMRIYIWMSDVGRLSLIRRAASLRAQVAETEWHWVACELRSLATHTICSARHYPASF